MALQTNDPRCLSGIRAILLVTNRMIGNASFRVTLFRKPSINNKDTMLLGR